jgi:hypothetical protein
MASPSLTGQGALQPLPSAPGVISSAAPGAVLALEAFALPESLVQDKSTRKTNTDQTNVGIPVLKINKVRLFCYVGFGSLPHYCRVSISAVSCVSLP